MKRLQAALLDQAASCEALGSPFMGRLLKVMAAHWHDAIPLNAIIAQFEGDIGSSGASLPLRLCGGLHALVLSGQDDGLTAVYPPHCPTDADLWHSVEHGLTAHHNFWREWLHTAPQTNEVRRAAALIAGAHLLASKYQLPFKVSELGASAGLNLMFDRFQLEIGSTQFGPTSDVCLRPDWSGLWPLPQNVEIADRAGVDIHPIDSTNPMERLRLKSYLWPDQPERQTLTQAAIDLQNAPVVQADAIDWLQTRLQPSRGQLHLVYHTIAWQYFPASHQRRGQDLLEAAGAVATEDSPLAWLRMEADAKKDSAALTLRLWPGDYSLDLARVDFHGRWVSWHGPRQIDS